ncbi:hypothetical protein B0H15DRAFT_554022 [Mycena belliarum]|uniref:Uncharacterized protein n=1 Tax=Mycena belliarum TaxID=1033014 RepID=A0AAD6XU22_9AGAR|nr:hypothetical protein B0H15DRAFT_554022 [Mycena belliae]
MWLWLCRELPVWDGSRRTSLGRTNLEQSTEGQCIAAQSVRSSDALTYAALYCPTAYKPASQLAHLHIELNMDANSLSNLSRSKIVALAKANKIKANLATKEIIRQLVQRFPDGVPPAPAKPPSTPVKSFVGRVKNTIMSITHSSTEPSSRPAPLSPAIAAEKAFGNAPPMGSTLQEPPAVEVVPRPGTPATINLVDGVVPGAVAEAPEKPADGDPANPEVVKLTIKDMAEASRNNRRCLKHAEDIRARAEKLQKEAAALRTMVRVEQAERERLESYFKHWQPIGPEWSYHAVWDGPVPVAEGLGRYSNAKGSVFMEREVSTSDDEVLVAEWQKQHAKFCARRRKATKKKAEQRQVDIEMVSSDEEMGSDEEAFYAPTILYDGSERGLELQPLFSEYQPGALFLDEAFGIPSNTRMVGKRPREDGDDEGRRTPPARLKSTRSAKDALDWDRAMVDGMREAVDGSWDGLGDFLDGWRMAGRA